MPECNCCNEELEDPRDKNKSGWWRDDCLKCISKRVTYDVPETPVVERDEYQEWLEDKE